MNYTESFDQFASRLGPTDLALYAGIGIVLWVLFKDKMSPVQQFITGMMSKLKGSNSSNNIVVEGPIPTDNILTDIFNPGQKVSPEPNTPESHFLNLVVSWKQTRDLAVKSGCSKAVEVADQMFPFLSPSVCEKENNNE